MTKTNRIISKKSNVEKPNELLSVFQNKCPRCRRGDMFVSKTTFARNFLEMPETCSECGLYYNLETGFWFGTGYVSYALTIAFSVSTFVAWLVLIGFSVYDNRIYYWLFGNAVFMILLQPWFMRISRTLWIRFFVKYNPNWATEPYEKSENNEE